MQTEPLCVNAALCAGGHHGGWRSGGGGGGQAQHLLPGAWPKGNTVGAGGGLQEPERVVGIGIGEVSHAFVFHEIAKARQ